MKVVLCEDNIELLEQIALYITNYAWIEENAIELVLKATQPLEVISYLQSNSADCYFLDINLGSEITGLDLAKQIRSIDPIASIIFVTSHSEMLQLTFRYHVEALDFIIKNEIINVQDNILSALKTAYQKYRKIGTHPNMQYYPLKIGEYIKNIELDSILFFQASKIAHKITVHTLQGEFEYYDTLNTIEDFNKHFYRIHRSFVVNIKNITKLDMKQRQVIMKNGEICPVSFRRLKLLEKAIREV